MFGKESAMTKPTELKNHTLSMRLPDADIAMIDRAARLRGRSRTDFVRDSAVRAAEDVIMETSLVRMSASDFAAFTSTLAAPAVAVPEIVELMRRSAPWEQPVLPPRD
jgi:uncharacterized protein (DUF1778 family)